MKRIYLFISLAALSASVALTACSSDELESQPALAKSNVISLTSSLNTTRNANMLQTTAIDGSVKVGAFGISEDETIVNGNNNQYTVSGTKLTAANEKEMTWPLDEEKKVSIYAYAPYQASWTYNSANTFTVKADQSIDTGYLDSDLLWASATNQSQPKETTTSSIALNFTHMLARINVTIQKGTSTSSTTSGTDADNISLNGAVISILGTKPSATLNPFTGVLGAASGTATDIKIATLSADETATVYGIIVPQTLKTGDPLVKILVGKRSFIAKLSTEADVTIESGKSYHFTAKVNSSGAELTLNSVSLTDWGAGTDLGSSKAEEQEVSYSPTSFVALASSQSATYSDGTYSWTAASNNLMTILEFPLSDGSTLANFKTLEVTTSNLTTDGKWRLGYVVDGGSYTNFAGFSTDQTGKTTIDLATLTGVDLSKVTKIQIGGASGNNNVNEGSLKISPNDVVLKGYVETSGSDDSGSGDGNTLTATFGTPGSKATYSGTTYSWTGSTSNLMQMFSFSNGELANYEKLTFTLSDLSSGESVRINFQYGEGSSDNINISTDKNGGSAVFGSNGEKTITMTYVTTALATVSKTLADVKAIRFGGNSDSGSCTIKASDVKLTKATE